jgi:putative thiamine transport system permease protein
MGDWRGAAATTLGIALAATGLSVALAIAWLEGEERGGYTRARWAEALIYLPLLLPQVAFLHGLYMVQLRVGLPAGPLAVIWVHAIFVFPYVMIALSDPWRALDRRLIATAAALGAGPARRLWRVRLPALAAPILTAAAIGFAVSVAQYLPTLFAGAGRVRTLTTEAVALASGSDRRVTAVHALWQALLPLCAYALAIRVPAILFHNRRGMMSGLAR